MLYEPLVYFLNFCTLYGMNQKHPRILDRKKSSCMDQKKGFSICTARKFLSEALCLFSQLFSLYAVQTRLLQKYPHLLDRKNFLKRSVSVFLLQESSPVTHFVYFFNCSFWLHRNKNKISLHDVLELFQRIFFQIIGEFALTSDSLSRMTQRYPHISEHVVSGVK